MKLVNSNEIHGYTIVENLGLVRGNTIRAKHLGKDIISAFRLLIGGEMKEYSEMMAEARDIATEQMIDEAEKLGADGIITIRYSTSSVVGGAAEIMVYGTAVKLKHK
jgi:uncharacterized protein YbjQ (UPF0145 family)